MTDRQTTFSRATYNLKCLSCGHEEQANTLVPIPERDRICVRCHRRMSATLADSDRQEREA